MKQYKVDIIDNFVYYEKTRLRILWLKSMKSITDKRVFIWLLTGKLQTKLKTLHLKLQWNNKIGRVISFVLYVHHLLTIDSFLQLKRQVIVENIRLNMNIAKKHFSWNVVVPAQQLSDPTEKKTTSCRGTCSGKAEKHRDVCTDNN